MNRITKARFQEPVVVVPEVPQEEPIQQELIGKGELSYLGGTVGRNKNIELGVQRLNGTVVAPGAEFSFTKALGEVTEEAGFSKEKIFLNGEVTKGVGGGLCQLSTTLFQTVMNTGLPVTERHNHSYSVSYYDVGLDATYADPGPDFRFVNDTLYPITIKGTALNHKVRFEIYGTPDGRVASTSEVEISQIVDFPPVRNVVVEALEKDQPLCRNTPQIGYTAKVIYEVLFSDGKKKEQIFTSKYKPLQRVCYSVASLPAFNTAEF
ncbi:MAG: VanW family protein [Candidatus Zambryskibacteria bacterium]|nr:VanW family protein [Candidatus Zambryskibacteria bacterium]